MADFLGLRLKRAADIIAADARTRAAAWSVQVPPSVSVKVSGDSATIRSAVGPSYPNEVPGVRHPVFGPTARNPHPGWVTNAYRPFLAPAAAAKADAAAAEIARSIDDICHDLGYGGTG